MLTKTLSIPPATEQRLLESAGEVFAEKGFRAATIREIVRRAGANIAAVNYHFGDKEGLYAAVFRYTRQFCQAKFPIESTPEIAPRERLHVIIRAMTYRVLDHGRPAWQWQLMAREMMEPTAVLDEMVAESIKPEFEIIAGVVREIAGLAVGDPRVQLAVNSILGQVLFYRHAQAVVQRLYPQQFEQDDLEALAEHVTEFSLGALAAMTTKPGAHPKERRA